MKHASTKSIQGNIKKKDIKNKKNTAEKCDQEKKNQTEKKVILIIHSLNHIVKL